MSRFVVVQSMSVRAVLAGQIGVPSAWRGGIGSGCVQRNDQRALSPVQVATQIDLLAAQSTMAEGQL